MARVRQIWAVVCGLAVLSGCSGPQLYSFLPSWPSSSSSHAESRVGPGGYVVRRGDTVYRIASSHGVPMRRFIEVNHLTPPYALQVGQVLQIPDRPTHTVRRGETVYRIAKMHNVDMSALVRVNDIREPYVIHIGQVLQLPGTTEPALDPPAPTAQSVAAAPQPEPSPQTTPQEAARTPTAPPPKAAAIPKPPPRQGRGLDWPVRGKVVVPFGSVAKGMRNDGINISAKLGTSVRAAEAGVVAYAGNELKGFGNMLLLKHEGGLITTYAHADEIKVTRGTTVKRGQIIASVGQTGAVTTPQLHFEVREGSKAVDPMRFLN